MRFWYFSISPRTRHVSMPHVSGWCIPFYMRWVICHCKQPFQARFLSIFDERDWPQTQYHNIAFADVCLPLTLVNVNLPSFLVSCQGLDLDLGHLYLLHIAQGFAIYCACLSWQKYRDSLLKLCCSVVGLNLHTFSEGTAIFCPIIICSFAALMTLMMSSLSQAGFLGIWLKQELFLM